MQARRLPARHGFLWLIASFRLFRANPPLLTTLTMTYLLVVIVVNFLPLIGPFLVPLALPTLIVILANGCRAIERGGGVGTVALTYGIQQHRVPLMRLGGLHLLGSVIVLVASMLVEGGHVPLIGADRDIDEAAVLGAMARLMIVALPAVTAFWFAPLLTAWDDVTPLKSVFFSFVASWRNWRAFAVYGLSVGAIAIALPGLLLITAGALSATVVNVFSMALKMVLVFVMAPIMMASVYVSYQDVFHGQGEGG
jgi:hypothetical protein